jgi:hypothetical protein
VARSKWLEIKQVTTPAGSCSRDQQGNGADYRYISSLEGWDIKPLDLGGTDAAEQHNGYAGKHKNSKEVSPRGAV